MRALPAQQEWVQHLTLMQQSVLFAAIRAPDGIRKDHPIKVLMRWYRRCILLSAFDGRTLLSPFEDGGGSFTGPFSRAHALDMGLLRGVTDETGKAYDAPGMWSQVRREVFGWTRDLYLRHVDELPHHFQLHLMHAAEIVGYKHPEAWIADWWLTFYRKIVNDAHLYPESEEQLDERLSDDEAAWRLREVVTAE